MGTRVTRERMMDGRINDETDYLARCSFYVALSFYQSFRIWQFEQLLTNIGSILVRRRKSVHVLEAFSCGVGYHTYFLSTQ